MLLLNIQYKASEIKVKFNMKDISLLEYLNSELFVRTFNNTLKDKFDNIISFHFTTGEKKATIKAEPFLQIYSDDKKFLNYLNEILKKINSSSKFLCQEISAKKIGELKLDLKEFLEEFFAQKVVEHNKQQGLCFLKVEKNKNSLNFNFDLKKFELGMFDIADFTNTFEKEAKQQIKEFKLCYYPNDDFDIEKTPAHGFKVNCINEKLLDELKVVFRELNKHSLYFYDRVNTDKYDFLRNELPAFFHQHIEKEILNIKLDNHTKKTKNFKL
jgi:hypothetical protein